jgi:DNA-binding transcriptional ArsR family regulator
MSTPTKRRRSNSPVQRGQRAHHPDPARTTPAMTTNPTAEQTIRDALATRPPSTASELAAATGLAPSTVRTWLLRLEQAGVAQRSVEASARPRGTQRWSLKSTARPSRARKTPKRLRPGELDALVISYLRAHASEDPLGPAAIAKALARSSGAVANCLARLAATGQIRQTAATPRRYTAA